MANELDGLYNPQAGLALEADIGGSEPTSLMQGLRTGMWNLLQSQIEAGAIKDKLLTGEIPESRIELIRAMSEEAEKFKGTVTRIEDVDSIPKFLSYMAFQTGAQVPVVASLLLGGGVGGLVGKGLAKGATKAAVEKELKKAAGIKEAIKRVEKKYVARGAGAGVASVTAPMHVGENAGEQIEVTGDVNVPLNLTVASLNTALDLLPVAHVARALGIGKGAERTFYRMLAEMPRAQRMALLATTTAAVETPTETLQELNNLLARKIIDENYEVLGPEGVSRLKNAAAAAAVSSPFFGALAGVPKVQRVVEEKGEEIKALPKPEDVPTVPSQEGAKETPSRVIPDRVFSPKRGPEEIYILGEDGIQHYRDVQVITSLSEEELQDLPPVARVLKAEEKLPQDESVYAPNVPEKKGTLEKNIPARGRARRYGKNLDALLRAYKGVLDDPKSYKSESAFVFGKTDKLTPAAKRRLQALERAIQETADRAGIVPQYPSGIRGQDTAQQPTTPPKESDTTLDLSRLSKGQRRIYERLSEKEVVEGLSEQEYEQLEKLQAIARGEVAENIKKLSPEERIAQERELLEELRKEEVLSAAKESEVVGIKRKEIADAIRPILRGLKVRPKVVIMNSLDFIGTELEERAIKSRGIFTNTTGRPYVILIEDNIGSKERAVATFLHEVFGHFGLRAIMDTKELNNFLRMVDKYANQDELLKIAEGYGPTILRELEQRGITGKAAQQRMREIVAEEYIAKQAEAGNFKLPFMKRLVARIRQLLRKLGVKLKLTENDIRLILRDIDTVLRSGKGAIDVGYQARDGEVYSAITSARLANLADELSMDELKEVAKEIESLGSVWGIRLKRGWLTLIQLVEQYNVPWAKDYLAEVEKWWASKMRFVSHANEVGIKWMQLPKAEANRLAQALYEISMESFERNERIPNNVIATQLVEKYQLGKEAVEIYFEVQRQLDNIVDEMERSLKYSAVREAFPDITKEEALDFLDQWQALRDRDAEFDEFVNLAKKWSKGELEEFSFLSHMLEIEQDATTMRLRNYFPLKRFGKWTVAVRAKEKMEFKGKTYKKGQLIAFYTYENQAAAKEGAALVRKEFKNLPTYVRESVLTDAEYQALGLPPSALRGKIESELQLTPEQIRRLRDIWIAMSPGKSWLKHLTRRQGIEGYSVDALRTFGSYMLSAASYLARAKHYYDMREPLNAMRNARRVTGELVENDRAFEFLREELEKHFSYLMKPENDLAMLRAWGFIFYLGFNVKSALVNATQVPMVTFPFLSAQYGTTQSMKAITDAYGKAVDVLRGRREKVDKDVVRMLDELIEIGVLDESQVSELAAIAEAPNLQKILPTQKGALWTNKVSYVAGWMFRHVEVFNRRVAAIAAYNLARQQGKSHEEATAAAKDAVQATQYEYAKWNRPRFFRGKASVVFLFYMYMQHTLYLMAGGRGMKTAAGVWFMLLMGAGLMGLPGAEDILDIISAGATKFKELTGMKNPRVDLKQALREWLAEYTDRPDLFLYGLGRYYGLGPLHLLKGAGIPVPNVDISGSLSLGRIVPGLRGAMESGDRNPEEKFGRTISDALGPVFAIGYNLWRAVESNEPDTWKKWERTLPTAFRNVSRSLRLTLRGTERTRDNVDLIEFDKTDPQQVAELMGMLFSFTPTRLRQVYERRRTIKEVQMYWMTRRAVLLDQLAFAVFAKNRKAEQDVKDAIREYNKGVPHPKLRITPQDRSRSLRTRRRRKKRIEAQFLAERRLQPLAAQIGRSFPELSTER